GSKDAKKKKELLADLLGLRKSDRKAEFGAANSWFVEGLAEYAATSALEIPNNERLFKVKEARKKNELWPLEQLTVYRSGSFPGVSTDAALSGYAQSWSFVTFLMKKHREGFLKYLDRMSRETPAADQDIQWLVEAIGVPLRPLENEWHAYIDTLETVDDPDIERIVRLQEILGL
ncbi:MAG TPA: DUF1570 domain-containing protein, partial [Candidatus Eisenbacteria bacterium]|nr:DUF1570 domain-containing protein [Candidatus Eisenbacteria bacterium]